MSDHRTNALTYSQANQTKFVGLLKDLVSIPSVSTDPAHSGDIHQAAQWVAARLAELGMEKVQILPTARHPVVYAESLQVGPSTPTMLIYGHYDVQPPDPLELWESAPFTPTVRGENLYGRGASDMKGQVVACMAALEACIHTGALPINVKWLIEGEEEIGSPNLKSFIASHQDLLACTFALNPDAGMINPHLPTITYALRGLAYFEIRLTGPDHDLHSGVFGGAVANPANVLAKLLAGLHDDQGRVTLPGFYQDVLPLDENERAELARLPMDADFYLAQTGAPALAAETGYSPVERTGARPTLDVNGLLSGFTGSGAKTVLPSQAMAKLSCRLVPNQDPAKIYAALQQYLQENAPPSVKWELTLHSGAPASISDRHSPAVQALSRALETLWGVRPVFKREGGSVPVVGQMQTLLGVDSVLTGFGLPDDNLHAPNEKLHLPTWYRGITALIHFIFNLAEEHA
jgi:acetylornithine deacetylase/succinyl-diaminopimelate desuccinylase-like protein